MMKFNNDITKFHNDEVKNTELRTGSEPVTFTLPM